MPVCESCGNEYDKTFVVVMDGKEHVFDSFECAIHTLAPKCYECGCRIIGHGVEAGMAVFCCAACAERYGIKGLRDRMDATVL